MAPGIQPIRLPRLIFVTGKGGTGKSTVAAALATALAGRRPTTLVDLDGHQSAMRLVTGHPDDAGAINNTTRARSSTSTDTLTNSPRPSPKDSQVAIDAITI